VVLGQELEIVPKTKLCDRAFWCKTGDDDNLTSMRRREIQEPLKTTRKIGRRVTEREEDY